MPQTGKIFFGEEWIEIEFELKDNKMYLTEKGLAMLVCGGSMLLADKYILALRNQKKAAAPAQDIHSTISGGPEVKVEMPIPTTSPAQPEVKKEPDVKGGWTKEKTDKIKNLITTLQIKDNNELNPYVHRWLGYPKDRAYTYKDITPEKVEEFVAFVENLIR